VDNEMNVHRNAALVRPQGDVDLIRSRQGRNGRGDTTKQRAELVGFGLIEVPDMNNVAPRFDDERSDPEGTDAVLDEPALRLVNASTWQVEATRGQVASEASFHARMANRRPPRNPNRNGG